MFVVRVAVLPSFEVAVTVIAQRPAVSSSGGNSNEPSSATLMVVAPGRAGPDPPEGTGVGAGAVEALPGAPRNAVVTATVFAFVVVPATAIAPLPYFVPST